MMLGRRSAIRASFPSSWEELPVRLVKGPTEPTVRTMFPNVSPAFLPHGCRRHRVPHELHEGVRKGFRCERCHETAARSLNDLRLIGDRRRDDWDPEIQ